jgi:protein-S-isoprenylcysteine O-methyltransferase Ste14
VAPTRGERWATIPYLVSGVAVIAVSFFLEVRYPVSGEVSRVLGIVCVAVGMAMVFWATLTARDAVLGEIEPRSERLVRTGPFALIRHPMYLGFTIALTGVALSARSWPGLLCVVLLFVPSAILRAKAEERALARKFKDEWVRYAGETGFLFPRPRRGRS